MMRYRIDSAKAALRVLLLPGRSDAEVATMTEFVGSPLVCDNSLAIGWSRQVDSRSRH